MLPPTSPRVPRGTTLLELALLLTVVGILLGIAAPAGRRAMDALAVRGARDALAAAAARGRLAAAAHGGATLRLTLPAGELTLVDGLDRPLAPPRRLGQEYGVVLAVDGVGTDRLELRWDVLGIGRAAARTVRVRKGGAEAGLTTSLYGRVRTW